MSDQQAQIVLDWGTSSFRAFLLAGDGTVSDAIETDDGIQNVPRGGHAERLARLLAPWRRDEPMRVVAGGMIGSRNGWIEMPYVPAPATAADLAAAARTLELPGGGAITFLPGLTDRRAHPYPDVMRGEETQLVGLGLDRAATVVLPGTHAKWARVGGGAIQGFRTFATGDVFATLSAHSFLAGAATAPADAASPAFAEGVALAQDDIARAGGFLTRLFALRSGWLAGALKPEDLRSYLSGLMVGWEFAEAGRGGWFAAGDRIAVVGDDDLVAVYGNVAARFGLRLLPARPDAALRGALAIIAARDG